MSSLADRRRAFAWLDLGALERIDRHAPENLAAGVRNVYLALGQMAARRHDGLHDGFEATRAELAALARVSERTFDRHIAELKRLELVDVETRVDEGTGGTLPHRYVLVDPPSGNPAARVATVAPPATVATGGVDTAAVTVATPPRARVNAVKKEEVGGESSKLLSPPSQEERARASSERGTSSIDRAEHRRADCTPDEQAVLLAICETAKARSLVTGWDPDAVIALCRNEFRNRDLTGEAERFRDYYSPGGAGEHRPFENLTLRWRKWLERAPSLDTVNRLAENRGGRRSRRRRRGRGPDAQVERMLSAKSRSAAGWHRINTPDLPVGPVRVIVGLFWARQLEPTSEEVRGLVDELGAGLTPEQVVRTMAARERHQKFVAWHGHHVPELPFETVARILFVFDRGGQRPTADDVRVLVEEHGVDITEDDVANTMADREGLHLQDDEEQAA